MNFEVGQILTMQRTTVALGTDINPTFEEGDEVTVRRVGTSRIQVRGINRRYNYREQYSSGWVDMDDVTPADPNAPRPRKLGEAPEGMIAPNDPRLKWLWEDAATYAKQKGYCGQYDEIVKHLGIPGRPRNYTASLKIGDITMTGRYLCQSADEARDKLRDELKASGILVPEGTAASVVES